jgi:hypothetical protein
MSEAHLSLKLINYAIKGAVESNSETTINVSYSFQNKTTDTLAVDADNNPFRDENGTVF